MFDDLPPNEELAREKIEEAARELASLEELWSRKVHSMLS